MSNSDYTENSKKAPWKEEGKRRCPKCKEFKVFDDYPKHKNRKNGISAYCRVCNCLMQNERNRSNPKAYTTKRRYYYERSRWKELFKNYGITKDQYESLEKQQDFKCKICGEVETFFVKGEFMTEGTIRRLSVDHCHATGKIRGLLCTRCNHGLGYFEDNVDILRKAIAYLESNQGV